ncbi:MAG TPA: hypothetical protein VGI03_10165 [Verrucomicrobiae bacterium]
MKHEISNPLLTGSNYYGNSFFANSFCLIHIEAVMAICDIQKIVV